MTKVTSGALQESAQGAAWVCTGLAKPTLAARHEGRGPPKLGYAYCVNYHQYVPS